MIKIVFNKNKARQMYFVVMVGIFMLVPDWLIEAIPIGEPYEWGFVFIAIALVVILFNRSGKYVKMIDEIAMFGFAFGVSLVLGDIFNFGVLIGGAGL